MSAMPTDYIAEAITEAYGERCPDFAEGCACCEAWRQYDALISATPPDVAGLVRKIDAVTNRVTCDFDSRDELLSQAATALRLSAGGGVPEGWKLVPVDPTPEMLGAFWRQKNCGTQEVGERGSHTDDYSAYRAMLAASPTVEAGHVE